MIATLTKERPHASINLFISLLDEVSLVAKGNGSVHITGFYEPDQDGLPKGLYDKDEDEDEDEDEEEEEVAPVKNIAAKPTVTAKVASPQQKPQSPPQKPAQQEKKAPAPVAAKVQVEDDEDEED